MAVTPTAIATAENVGGIFTYAGGLSECLVVKGVALVFQKLKIFFRMPIERHTHLPGPGKHLGVLDRGFVVDVVGVGERVAFDHVQSVAVEIAGPVEPGLVVEISYVDDQCVPIPEAPRVPHPPVDMTRGMPTPIHIDLTNRVSVLVENLDAG